MSSKHSDLSRLASSHDSQEFDDIAALQRHLLPSSIPTIPGYDFAVLYRPSHAAGGDYYDFQRFPDGRLGFMIADVAGHGAAAAVMMAVLRGACAAFRAFERIRENAAQDLNSIINEVAVPGVFVTAFLVSLDPPTGRVFCGNCGHPSALIRRSAGSIETLDTARDLPLGIIEAIDPPMISATLEPGDSLILYTDGITEARNHSREFYSEARLRAAILGSGCTTSEALLTSISTSVAEHEQGVRQGDDQCLLICTRRTPE